MPTIDLVATGRNIRRMRIAAGLTVRDLHTALGVSPQAIQKWQAGIALPTVDNLFVLAHMLGVQIDDILVAA